MFLKSASYVSALVARCETAWFSKVIVPQGFPSGLSNCSLDLKEHKHFPDCRSRSFLIHGERDPFGKTFES